MEQQFWSTADLRARGRTSRMIAGAAASGLLIPTRNGWYAQAGTDAELIRAAVVGGVATAHSAARAMELWTPPDAPRSAFRHPSPPVLRVAVPKTTSAARLRDPDRSGLPLGTREDVLTCWTDPACIRAGRRTGVVSVLVMLRDLFRTEPPERALAVADSALHHRHLRPTDLHTLAAMLPAHLGAVALQADGRAQSGTETIARYFLRLAGLRVEPQAGIPGVGHVDLLVEGRVVVEVDGRAWHDDEERFAQDRRRDLVAATGRYRVLRFSWFQVLFRWPEVEAAVFAALAS